MYIRMRQKRRNKREEEEEVVGGKGCDGSCGCECGARPRERRGREERESEGACRRGCPSWATLAQHGPTSASVTRPSPATAAAALVAGQINTHHQAPSFAPPIPESGLSLPPPQSPPPQSRPHPISNTHTHTHTPIHTTMSRRTATLNRNTNETKISVSISLDGGSVDTADSAAASTHAAQSDSAQSIAVNSGVGFLDHMLHALAKHSGWSLSLTCDGDLHS